MNWTTENIGSLNGKRVIVTGANSGLGFETAKALAARGARTVLACRDTDKGSKASAQIWHDHPYADIEIMKLDLADLESVASFVHNFKKQNNRLDLLINNAGVMIPPYTKTKDGFELQFGTNHLGHFALTAQLMPLLMQTHGSRVINVSSLASRCGKPDFSDLSWEKRKYCRWNAYGDSKLANLLFTAELSRRLSGTGTIVTAAHPGGASTNLQRHSCLVRCLLNPLLQSQANGALPILRAATDGDAANGDYFGPKGCCEIKGAAVKVKTPKRAQDEQRAATLWEISEKMTGTKFNI